MKVAFVLGTSGGGTGAHVRMLAAGLTAREVSAEVFGPAQADRDFRFSETVAFRPVEISDRPHPAQDVRTVIRLRGLLYSGGFDVVHAHGLRAGALTAIALRARMPRFRPTGSRGHASRGPASRSSRPALVVTVHNAPVAGGAVGAIYRVLELIVARSADSVLCVSADLIERMRAAGARQVGAAVVPSPQTPAASLPPDAQLAAPAGSAGRSAGAADTPVVLAVGRLAPQKGFGTLIEAAAGWQDLRPVPRLMIVGEGPLQAELMAQAASLGVPVEFAGRRTDVPALLAAAAVFALPSMWEGQALILQEALRAGAAVVATRTGGNPDIIGEDAALLVPPGDPAQLADAVRAILTDQALVSRLRKAALERARSLPDVEAAVTAVVTEYRRVMLDG